MLCIKLQRTKYLTEVTAVNVALKVLNYYLVEAEILFQIYSEAHIQHM